MAKVLLYDKQIEDSIFISGILDKSAKNITYSENDEIKKTTVKSLLKEFVNKKIDLIIFTEYEKDKMLNIDQYRDSTIFGSLNDDENIILGVLDGESKILKGII